MRKPIFFILIFTLLFLTSNCSEGQKETLIIGHRGAMGYETENTLASIEKALELGVDMIEIDVFKIKSGETVVFHDDRVGRLTNGAGNIEEYNIVDLKALTLDGGHKIPMLQDVLKLIDGKCELNIELKGENTAERVDYILDYYIEKNSWDKEDFVISSFNWDELRKFRELDKDIKIGVLTEEDPLNAIETAKELNAVAIHPDFSTLDKAKVEQMQKEGFKVYTWTVNDEGDIQKMKSFGVDGIITNYPDRVH